MAVKYRTVKRKILTGEEKDKTKVFAIAKTTGVCDLQKLCKLISARSTVSSADVKAVLDGLNWAMDLELQSGNIVQVGELGNFRLSLSSEGANLEEKFDATKIRNANVIFYPGKSLRLTRDEATFTADDVKVVEKAPIPDEAGGDDIL